jgi:hypothetical protein
VEVLALAPWVAQLYRCPNAQGTKVSGANVAFSAIFENSSGLFYKHITILNDDSSIVNK